MEPAYIVAAFAGGVVAMGLRLPPLVGFLAAGFVLNALGYGETGVLDTVASLGVTLLLFTIGLKLNVRTLLRAEVWGTATLHMAVSTGLMTGALALFKVAGLALLRDDSWQALVLVGFALSFSSTVFAVKILEDRGEARSLYGRIAIGVLIMQDIVAVVFLTASTAELPSPWALLLIGLVPLAPLLQRLLARMGHGEMQVLFGIVLALVLGYWLFDTVGVKGDLGALVVGMLLAPHPAASDLSKSLFNLKELFLVGFFLSIGLTALPTPEMVAMALIVVGLLPLKTALFLLLFSGFRLRHRTSVLASLALSNFSEFGLIVAVLSASLGWLSDDWLVMLAMAVAISFALAALLNTRSESLYRRASRLLPDRDPSRLHPGDRPIELGSAQAVVLGMGRVGRGAYQQLEQEYELRVLGVDNDPGRVAGLRATGYNLVEGDAVDSDFWDKLVVSDDVEIVLLALPHHAANLYALEQLRNRESPARFAVGIRHADEAVDLLERGADAVFNVFEEAGLSLAESAMASLGRRGRPPRLSPD